VRRPRTKSRRPAKTRRGRTTKTKRNNAPTAARRASSIFADLQEQVSALTHELAEAREQQTATAEVLSVISSSPGELEPVFQAMLSNATRLCEANFGNLLLYDGGAFRFAAMHGAPPAWKELRGRRRAAQPTSIGSQGYGIELETLASWPALMFAAIIALPPFRGFVGDELAELGGRHGHRNAANVGEPRPDLRIGETRIDLLVELVDHVGRRARRCADPWRLTGHSAKVNVAPDEPDTLVSRFRSSPEFAARSRADFGIKGTLATL